MTALLKDALDPNLVQTLANNPAIIHEMCIRDRHSVWSGCCNAGLCRQAGGARCLMAA